MEWLGTAILFNGFFNGFGIPQPLCTIVFDGRPPSSAKGCDNHMLSFRSRWGEGEIFPIYYNCHFSGVGGRAILVLLLLEMYFIQPSQFRSFFSDISMRSDTAVFVKAFSFLRLLTGRGSSNGSAEIFHRRKRKSSFDEKRLFFGDFMRRACLSGRREFGAWEKLLAFQERKTRSHFFLRFSSRKHFSSSLRDYARR